MDFRTTGVHFYGGGNHMYEKERRVHPTPQWMRKRFMLLDGVWKLNNDRIRVPFPPESAAGKYRGRLLGDYEYTTHFEVPEDFTMKRILLHFGAVDQKCEVFLNGKRIGSHVGGYLSFTFDITDVCKRRGKNELIVRAHDSLSLKLPYGKQKKNPGGMWYTQVSGIWKSVWIENVPDKYIKAARMTPDLEGLLVEINLEGRTEELEYTVMFENEEGKQSYSKTIYPGGDRCRFYINLQTLFAKGILKGEIRHWKPDDPFLYELVLKSGKDRIVTYFALRTVDIRQVLGVNRVCLNGEPIFLHGVLDQGYYKKGIYVAEVPEDYDNDIMNMKELGYNFIRKHIKLEPEYFYYAADKIGILVMQDMINNGSYSFFWDTIMPNVTAKMRPDFLFRESERERKEFFIKHCHGMVSAVRNHPCIFAYTIFNEGWGQFESDRIYTLMKHWDPSRLVDSTSGWFAQQKSDFDSEHIYFRNIRLHPKIRPMLLSECGGFEMVVEGHVYHKVTSMGYGMAKTSEELTDKIEDMYTKMVLPAIKEGLCGCVYTQLSDVEGEISGIYTYDRHTCKVDKERIKRISATIFDEFKRSIENRNKVSEALS